MHWPKLGKVWDVVTAVCDQDGMMRHWDNNRSWWPALHFTQWTALYFSFYVTNIHWSRVEENSAKMSFYLFQLYTNLLLCKIELQVLFLLIDVTTTTWMQQHTGSLCWLIYRQKTSITPVLFSAVQRIHASSLQRSFFPMNPRIFCCIKHNVLEKAGSIFSENSSH